MHTKKANAFEFFRSLVANWKSAMSGAASIALAFIGVYIPATEFKAALFTAAGLSFLWSAYNVWSVERNRVIALEAHAEKPDLLATIDQCYQSWDTPLRLLLRLTLVNKSPVQATVKGIALDILTEGGAIPFSFREDATTDDATFVITELGSGKKLTQSRQLDDLLRTVAVTPLERGIHREGDLIYIFDEVADLNVSEKLRLTIIDAFGNEHKTEQEVEIIKGVWLE